MKVYSASSASYKSTFLSDSIGSQPNMAPSISLLASSTEMGLSQHRHKQEALSVVRAACTLPIKSLPSAEVACLVRNTASSAHGCIFAAKGHRARDICLASFVRRPRMPARPLPVRHGRFRAGLGCTLPTGEGFPIFARYDTFARTSHAL